MISASDCLFENMLKNVNIFAQLEDEEGKI